MYAYVHLPLTLTLTVTLPAKPVSVWLYKFCLYFAYFFVHRILGKIDGMDEIIATKILKSDSAGEGRLFIEKVVNDIISRRKSAETIPRDVYMDIELCHKPILIAMKFLEKNVNVKRCLKLIKDHCKIHVIYIYIYCIYINVYIYIRIYY
jgi:hypothetical protein